MKKIDWVKKRFVEEGFDFALDGSASDRVYAKRQTGILKPFWLP
jgi:hypothetical protein